MGVYSLMPPFVTNFARGQRPADGLFGEDAQIAAVSMHAVSFSEIEARSPPRSTQLEQVCPLSGSSGPTPQPAGPPIPDIISNPAQHMEATMDRTISPFNRYTANVLKAQIRYVPSLRLAT